MLGLKPQPVSWAHIILGLNLSRYQKQSVPEDNMHVTLAPALVTLATQASVGLD